MKRINWLEVVAILVLMWPLWVLVLEVACANLSTEKEEDVQRISVVQEAIPANNIECETMVIEQFEEVEVRCTAYCPCSYCCGWNTGITYSGTKAEAGRTIGANLNRFPIGTEIEIDGVLYTVEDTGNLGENTIDIFFDTHEEALQYGVHYTTAKVKK